MDAAANAIHMDRAPSRADGEPQTRTGVRVRQLVKDVEADLTEIEDMLARARGRLASLEREARGINGLSASCRGWGQQLDKMIVDLDEERGQVERTMLGSGRAISEKVDGDLRERIRIARQG